MTLGGLTMGVTAGTLVGSDLAADRAQVEEGLIDVSRAFDLLVLPLAGLRMRIPGLREAMQGRGPLPAGIR